MVPDNLIKEGEKFVEIFGSNKEYYVSNFGRIYSCPKISNHNRKGLFLKAAMSRKGYLRLVLRKVSGKSLSVHRLVAEHFIANPEILPQVNHIDSNKKNNSAYNLEWVTASGNIAHSHKTTNRMTQKIKDTAAGLMKQHGLAKRQLSMEQAIEIRHQHKGRFDTKRLAIQYGVGMNVIRQIVKGETYNEDGTIK